jgi:tetratricopeptide (TPR) repeat protein
MLCADPHHPTLILNRMKLVFLLALLFSSFSYGQDLKFTTPYYDAVDKWIAFDKKPADSTYVVGFIYIDEQAGFTFDYEARFAVTAKGLKKLSREFEHGLKSRLSPNTVDVAVLTDEQVRQLGLPQQPEWLKNYKANENEVSYLLKIGYHYNHVGASANAIKPLLEAYEKDPRFEGLEFELAYAYNATKQYEKAVDVLKEALKHDSTNFWFYRELGFAYRFMNRIQDAEKVYNTGISLSNDDAQKGEMAVNMAQHYFLVKDKPKFEEWAKLVQKYSKGSKFAEYVEYWRKNWDKK